MRVAVRFPVTPRPLQIGALLQGRASRDDTAMGMATYRDLAEFGLPLVTPAQPEFASLVHDVESRPEPFGSWPIEELSNAAVLLNESNNAVLGISCLWRYTTATGAFTSRFLNLGSSTQLDVMTGRSEVVEDLGTFILRGSKRLITERGMFGNNLDVLGREKRFGGGYIGGGGGGGRTRRGEEIVAVELVLDLAILEDGRCVGPDEAGLFDSLIEDLEQIRRTAEAAANALGNGGSSGEIFEMLRPLARKTPERTAQRRSRSPFRSMFAHMSIDRLINDDSAAVASWLEGYAQPPRFRLHRAS